MEIRLLGPLEVWSGGRYIELRGGRAHKLLAALALEPDRTVPIGRLVDVLWDDDPPATAVRQVRNIAAAVRRLLDRPDVLLTDRSGYRLRTANLLLDTEIFDEQLTLAGDAVAAGDLEKAADALRSALDLWQGNALAGIRSRILASAAIRLDERRLGAVEDWLELELTLGRHHCLTGELAALVTEHPLRERFTAQLMRALYRKGRVGEALEAYRRLRTRLTAELGLDTGPELRGLQSAILRADPALTLPAPRRPAPARPATPRQLPAAPAVFAGRTAPLTELESLLGKENTRAGRIVTIDGGAGIGKTALATHFAHRVAERFPDGHIWVNLNGFDPGQHPVPPGTALGRLLRTLGADPASIPPGLDEQAALYRTLLAGRRVLIVLDNAAGAEQIRPLLPGTRTSLVVITSRNRLPGLTARPGTHRITLGPLTRAEAMTLLRRTIGAERVRTEAGAAADLVELTARVPLALRLTGERAAGQPARRIRDLATELRDERARLDPPATGDRAGGLRAVLSHAYRALDVPAATLFRLLGVNPGQDIGLAAAAALAGWSTPDTRRRLEALVAAGLLTEAAPDRYTWHDLLRGYARERAGTVDSTRQRRRAAHQLLDFYLHTAQQANRQLCRRNAPIPLEPPVPGVRPLTFTSHRRAAAWCESERDNLVAAVRFAADQGFHEHAWKLPCLLWEFFNLRKHRADWIATHESGLAAARRLGDRFAESCVLNGLASAHGQSGRHQAALGYYGELLELVTHGTALGYVDTVPRIEQEIGEEMVLTNIGECYRNLGRHQDALRHYQRAHAVGKASSQPSVTATLTVPPPGIRICARTNRTSGDRDDTEPRSTRQPHRSLERNDSS
ncbi:MAG TPA: BTAD domain-containing putative transcriptional regulator [Actinophytocola sp.]|jgi:DNA-binding SARP family transcriptional activator|uniref:BTAD domain-containing putative transcriptional regulator n=1 Tax=Actinophytocola sp. TaxID=1872138 RepID=UPI002E09804D|nr:BTAD domain-containing putative transcriptional regulator [Actinophytocola sp.]